jgi:aminoglycoside phosphotransferase (APT) family kinase protein
MVREMTPSQQNIVSLTQSDHILSESLHELASEWRTDCLIHGDLKPSNVLVANTSAERCFKQPLLIDWEHSGIGDPAWDVAAVFAGYVLHWSLGSKKARSTPDYAPTPSRKTLGRVQRATREFWNAYARNSFTPGVSESSKERLSRAVKFLPGRLLQYAIERARYEDPIRPQTAQLVQLAANVVRFPLEAVGTILGISA